MPRLCALHHPRYRQLCWCCLQRHPASNIMSAGVHNTACLELQTRAPNTAGCQQQLHTLLHVFSCLLTHLTATDYTCINAMSAQQELHTASLHYKRQTAIAHSLVVVDACCRWSNMCIFRHMCHSKTYAFSHIDYTYPYGDNKLPCDL